MRLERRETVKMAMMRKWNTLSG